MARIRTQLPITTKKKRADYVVDNSGTRDETRRQIEAVFSELLALRDFRDRHRS
jgi:dephospho-CoA kinase